MPLLCPFNTHEEFISLSLPDIIWCKMKDLFRSYQKNTNNIFSTEKDCYGCTMTTYIFK